MISIGRRRVPSLARLCLRVLARYPGHVPIDVRLNYHPIYSDVLDDVLDDALDPTLWSALVQVYDGLPSHLRSLTISLADPRLSFLQKIPQTSLFSLMTILDLPACPHLTDTSIVRLGPLHSLVALDASATPLSSYAIKVLSGTLLWINDGPQRRGPWSLRILRLRFCDKIDDSIYSHLTKFPLLAAIDLRGTQCRPPKNIFKPSSRSDLFHPAPLAAAVDALEGADLYTSKNVFHLIVDNLKHSKATYSLPQHILEQDEHIDPHETESTPMSRCSTRQLESILDTTSLESTPRMFYSQLSHSSRPIRYDLVNDYSAKTYYTWAHLDAVARPAGPHDSKLALYRTPPPWIALEEHSAFLLNQTEARRSTKDKAVTRVASINRTERIFQINQARIDALRESASARRRSGVGVSNNTPESKQVPGVQGRNPFRRYSVPGIVGHLDRGIDLRSISAVEVPELPPNSKADGDVKCSSAIANSPGVKSSSFMGPSLHKTKPVAFHSTWSGCSDSQITSMKRTPSIDSSRTKKCRVDDGLVVGDKGKKKPTQVKKGFDWNTWGAKSS
ncbi:hypothetical protein C0995_005078 [Termitomyces sp. Mi166|nr:hypothetical protein C0995_005078 [Termitomyces sp. Mi166\